MTSFTVLTPADAIVADLEVVDIGMANKALLLAPDDVSAVLGWELKPEGLCRDDVCVPLRDELASRVDDRVDLVGLAGLLGCTVLADERNGVAAISVAASQRNNALVGRRAPDFTLPDLDGELHSLEQFKDRKRLLVAFASW